MNFPANLFHGFNVNIEKKFQQRLNSSNPSFSNDFLGITETTTSDLL